MVCTANDLLEWKDFPKGLRILLLDEDRDSAAELTSKLEQMKYIVTSFFSEKEALSTIESRKESFHVAIVEINTQNSNGRYSFLETAKDIPTIMISKEQCMSGMMKCIALGAVEFLVKPLSEEKLRNIWQHVVHKAFNTSGSANSDLLRSVKDFVGSVLKLQQLSKATEPQVSEEPINDTEMEQNDSDQSTVIDKFPAPSTPQIRQGGRSLDDGDYHDQTNSSPINEISREVDGEAKSVDTTFGNSFANNMLLDDTPRPTANASIKKDDDSSDSSKGSDNLSPKLHDQEDAVVPDDNSGSSNKESNHKNVCALKSSRKKMKVDWTPELHKKFVQAVEQLGVDQAIPSRILELMKVGGLTRHNVASHLQKYRMHRRHILPKEEERRWPQPRDSQRNYYSHRPVMAYPPYHTNQTYAPGQVYPVWGQQGVRPPGYPMWSHPTVPWQPIESWHWKPYPAMHADAWGCPVMPPPPPCSSAGYTQVHGAYRFHSPDTYVKHSADADLGEEVIEKVVKEVMSKPWLPLPLGLKPPSTEIVLAELNQQGISTVPPPINGHQ